MEAARKAQLVIANGGSPTAQQALSAGVPVLGIPSNMDQHLNMSYVAQAGAGILLRSEHATPNRVLAAVRQLLGTTSYRAAAQRLSKAFASYDAAQILDGVLANMAGQPEGLSDF
jgi:UDP:flavonoid glycosyltransferase YjiC (YdhE family)